MERTCSGSSKWYEDIYRYAYVRGPAGSLIGLVEEIGGAAGGDG